MKLSKELRGHHSTYVQKAEEYELINTRSPAEAPAPADFLCRFCRLCTIVNLKQTVLCKLLAVVSIVELVVIRSMNKGKPDYAGIKPLNLKMAPSAVLKTLLASVILLTAAYLALGLIKYLFNQDFRMWMAVFAEMKVEYWRYVLRIAIFILPSFIIIGMATNYTIPDNMAEWLDMLIVVVANSVGVWLLALINISVLRSSGTLVSNFTSTYGMLIIVPTVIVVNLTAAVLHFRTFLICWEKKSNRTALKLDN